MDSQLNPRFRPAALAVATLMLAGGCANAPSSGLVAADASAGTPDSIVAEEGVGAPDFTLPTIDGEELRLEDTAGQVRLIDFWATWCAPCREEVPMLNELQASYADRGFVLLAISDEEAGVIREFVEDYEVAYTNLVGTEEVIEAYGVLGLPAAFLLDGEGRVVETFLGPKPRSVLVKKIEALLEAT